MVYYNDNELIIRNMEEADARVFTDEEIAQGWHTDISKYLDILRASSKEAFLSPRSIRPIVRPQEPIATAKSSWHMFRSVLTCFKVVDTAIIIPPFK